MSRFRPLVRLASPRLTLLEDRTTPAPFAPGSIQGQDGWSGGSVAISPAVTQGVDQTGTLGRLGSGAFVVSNGTTNGNFNGGFAGWPVGPALSVAAGQPSSGASADLFNATVWFRTVSSTADGSTIEIDLGVADGSDRNSFVGIVNDTDANDGLQFYIAEPNGTTGNFYAYQYSPNNLARGVWHRLDIAATFRDGSANDTYTLSLNGVQVINTATNAPDFGTLEGYYEGVGQAYKQTSRLMFRSGFSPNQYAAEFDDLTAAGFAFDDVSYTSANSSSPNVPLASYYAAFEVRPTVVYSNPSWAALTNGTAITDANPNQAGDQPATVGVDAFGTLSAASAAVAPGGQLLAFPSSTTGDATISTGTTLNVGGPNGAGAVTNVGNVAFASGSILSLDLLGATAGTQHDQFTVTGTADIGAAVLQVNAGYTPAPADSFTILQAGSVVGQFAGLSDGAVITLGGLSYRVRYTTTAVTLELDRADLSVTITDNLTSVAAGQQVSYTVVVRNNGPRAVTGAVFALTPPAGLLNATFGSVPSGGATGATGGAGPISNTLNLPVGAFVTYTVTGTVSPTATGTLAVTATVTPPATAVVDGATANNTATDTDTITPVTPPDTTSPTVQVIPNATLVVGTPVTILINFSESVTGFGPAQLGLANATLSSFNGSGAAYTAVIVPTSTSVQVGLPQGAGVDAAGNPSVLSISSFIAALPQTPAPTLRPRYATAAGGIVKVFNPTDGSVREVTPFPNFGGIVTVATGDLNGDGIPETVVGAGAGGTPHVKVYDGATGQDVLNFLAYDSAFSGGVFVAVGGGRIFTGAGAGGTPHVKAFDSLGRTLYGFLAYNQSFSGGVTVAVGDVNRDGVADLVTGAGAGATPHVRVYDGVSGLNTLNFLAYDSTFAGGVFVAAGSGRIITGAGAGGTSHVRVFDGSTGQNTHNLTAYDGGFSGGVRVALGDVNNDGTADLITAAGPGSTQEVKVFSFPSLTLTSSFLANPVQSPGLVRFGSDANSPTASPGVFVG